MNKNHYRRAVGTTVWLTLLLALVGCAATDRQVPLSDMQAFALCRDTQQAQQVEKQIAAEYGFQRFAPGAYQPRLEQRLFGHEIRVVELGQTFNKLYVAGHLPEFQYNFGTILPHLVCDADNCQAPLDNGQSLLIYKPALKKSKDTVVIECSKAADSEAED